MSFFEMSPEEMVSTFQQFSDEGSDSFVESQHADDNDPYCRQLKSKLESSRFIYGTDKSQQRLARRMELARIALNHPERAAEVEAELKKMRDNFYRDLHSGASREASTDPLDKDLPAAKSDTGRASVLRESIQLGEFAAPDQAPSHDTLPRAITSAVNYEVPAPGSHMWQRLEHLRTQDPELYLWVKDLEHKFITLVSGPLTHPPATTSLHLNTPSEVEILQNHSEGRKDTAVLRPLEGEALDKLISAAVSHNQSRSTPQDVAFRVDGDSYDGDHDDEFDRVFAQKMREYC